MSDGQSRKRWPGDSDEAFPEVFCTAPPQPTTVKPGQLSPDQVAQFFTEGFVVIDKYFETEELDACRRDIELLVDDLANKLHDAGKIKHLYKEYGLFERLTRIEEEFPGANVILHKLGKLPKGIRDLWSNERLLNAVEQLIGPDIAGHPVFNLRTKTPNNEATVVPWHQDAAYFDNECYKTMVATAWIPFLDAVPENGCMQFVRRGHVTGKVCTHQCCAGGTWYVMVEEEEMEKTLGVDMKKDTVITPIPYGGLVLFSNIIPHRSLPNTSNDVRWSVDLRWQNSHYSFAHFGMKPGVVMRSSLDPDLQIDWETFDSQNRHTQAMAAIGKEVDELDTTIQGPWMKKWELVHMNTHTEAFQKSQQAQR